MPICLTAPGEGNDGEQTKELNLNAQRIEFLRYDWCRPGAGEDQEC